jgi:hypothetical protein
MDGCMEQPRAPALGVLAVARMLWEVGNHTGMDKTLPMTCGITATIEVAVSASRVQTDLLGHHLQGVQSL